MVVLLADELELVQDVQLLAGGQLLVAHDAREAAQVEHLALRTAHQVARGDALRAAAALGAKPPGAKKHRRGRRYSIIHLHLGRLADAFIQSDLQFVRRKRNIKISLSVQ